MKAMQKRFNILGMVLTLIMVIGLIVQYTYLNNLIAKEKQKNIVTTREHLAETINNKMNIYNQYVDISAELIGSNNWNDDEITEYMEMLVKSNNLIRSVYYGDKDNKLINSDQWDPPSDYDVRTRPWYVEAFKRNKLAISEVYVNVLDKSTVISISKPVYDQYQNFMGVVSTDIAIEEIVRIVEETRIQGSGYSFLIDRTGNLLAHPKYKYNLGSGLINIDSLGSEIYKEIQTIKMGQMEVELDGEEGYLTYRPVTNTNWIIGNFISLKDFKGDNSELWRIFIIATMIAIVIFASFTYLQRKSFLIPLLKLGKDIEKINVEKNIAYRIPLEIKDPFIGIKKTLNLTLSKTQSLVEQVERDKEEMAAQNDELNYLSYNDPLTGLYNRRYFEKMLGKIDKQSNLPISLIMGDANGLKLINDSFGHKAGDNLLISIANTIKQACRAEDMVSRISGDEFVIILPKTSKEEAELVISRMQDLSKQNKVESDNFTGIEISVSYGLGTKNNIGTDILAVLKIAEEKMYSKKILEGPEMRRRTIETIIKELCEKDKNKENHSKKVANISKEIGVELGMEHGMLGELMDAAKVHDIGEIATSQEILNKTGQLSPEEWAEIKKHPEIGYRILSTLSEMSNLAHYTLAHHERYDGSGYPKGLKGEEIPLISRIIAIANAYDAMGSDRPYRKALNEDEIVLEFINNAGTQFDPGLAKLFVEEILKREWVA